MKVLPFYNFDVPSKKNTIIKWHVINDHKAKKENTLQPVKIL